MHSFLALLSDVADSQAVKFAMQVCMVALLGYITALLNSKKGQLQSIDTKADIAAINARTAAVKSLEVSRKVDMIHQAVNGEKLALVDKVEELKSEIRNLTRGGNETT